MAEQEIKEIVPYTFDDIYNDISRKFESQGYDTSPGSNISQLITSMSYAVSMLNANTAMNINEMILPYANRRENVLTSARNLAYEARHKTSYVYDLTLKSKTGTFIIPKYTVFKQSGNEYVYMGKQLEIYGSPDDALKITVKEGKIYKYTDSETLHVFIGRVQDPAGNIVPQYYIDIPFINVEEDGIEVLCTYMDEYGVLHEKEPWEKAPSLNIEIDDDPDVRQYFRIDNIEYGTPRIYFRYSGIGKQLQLGTEVFINILESHGSRGAMDLDDAASIKCHDNDIEVLSASLVSSGSDEETQESIKINAPKMHNSSNRLVVSQDYIAACKRDQRVKNCVVWGGEDEFPKAPGHIWFSFLPPGTHNFTHDNTYSKWTRQGISYEWDYSLPDKTEQEKSRDEYYRLNYIPEESIRSPYRNDDGTVANPGIWDRLDALKIPTLVYHHRAPIYCEFNYDIEIAKYLAYDSKSSMHTDMFNIIDATFSGVGDDLQYENFDVEYFNSNLVKRIDKRASDLSGFNMSLSTRLVLNEQCVATENLQPEYKDIYIPLAVPFEKYFDKQGFLMVDRLPSIDTADFVSYLEDGVKGRIFTDWSLIRDDIEHNKRQQHHKIIYAPIKVQWKHEYSFKDRTENTKVLLPFEIQPDDYLQTGDVDSQYTFANTKIVHLKWNSGLHDYDSIELQYGKDWYWDTDAPAEIRLDALVQLSDEDSLRIQTEAQAGWYYLFNSFKKEILVHLFVDGTKSGFSLSLAGDWSKDPSADNESRYLYSYDDYYGATEDSYYHYTRSRLEDDFTVDSMSDNYTQNEASLSAQKSYVDTTNTQPRAFLTTMDGDTLTTVDHWFLTTNGYVIEHEEDRNSYTGPVIREINKFMYTRSPLKYDLFFRNRYLDLSYLSNSFSVIKNVIPVLKQVEFYSLTDDGASQTNNFIDITFNAQGGSLSADETMQVRRGITWGQIVAQLKDPTKPYNTFKWWSLEAYGPQIPQEKRFTNSTTIYAVYKTLTYDITLDGNEGTIVPEHISVRAGTKWGSIEDNSKATRKNYIMDGFSKTKNGDRIPRDEVILENTKAYVRWAEHKNITITFDAKGGSSQANLEILSGFTWGQIKDRTQIPVLDGYEFSHWCLDPSLTQVLRDDTMIIEDCTLYAAYTEKMVKIKFDMHGSAPIINDLEIRRLTTWSVVKRKIKTPSKSGSLFLGWSLNPDIDFREIIRDEFTFKDYNYTVHALFTDKICTLRFNTNGGSPEQPYIIFERGSKWSDVKDRVRTPSKSGFEFLGWSLAPEGSPISDEFIFSTDVVTLHATWSYAGCIFDFDTRGGTAVNPTKITRGARWIDIRYSIATPTRKMYLFKGWSLDRDSYIPIADSKQFTEDHYTLYAHWDYNISTLVFVEQGGTFIEDLQVTKGTLWKEAKTLMGETVKPGFTLQGWSLEPDGGIIPDDTVFTDDSIVLHAIWVKQ